MPQPQFPVRRTRVLLSEPLVFLGLTLLLLSGCDSGAIPTYSTGGTVTFEDGSPLAGGRVLFKPVDNTHNLSATGTIQDDGSFELTTFEEGDGTVAGEHEVLVVPPRANVDRDEVRVPPRVIAEKYERFSTSELRFTVTKQASKNRFDIKVQRP